MNSVVIVGRAGQDPEVKYFESGKVKTTFSVFNYTTKIQKSIRKRSNFMEKPSAVSLTAADGLTAVQNTPAAEP